jgi:urate oxidase
MAKLAENRYGKSRVRMARVKRGENWHELCEWTVEVLLSGDFEDCFVRGDNRQILPTDTMKNTVYALARDCAADSIESFGKELASFLLTRNPQVSLAEVAIAETLWDHLDAAGKTYPSAFVRSGRESQSTTVAEKRGSPPLVVSGLEDLAVLKTSGSAFEGFFRDSLTTLPETKDRLFGTALGAHWTYDSPDLPFPELRTSIRETLLATFAGHQSQSVQHTLYAMGAEVLARVARVKDIELSMPNKHYLLVDLSRFGQDNPGEIFVPTDEPHGYIEARICRE